jgi:methylmalonyl-CoA/ethylmalonyl-CoA epimerase
MTSSAGRSRGPTLPPTGLTTSRAGHLTRLHHIGIATPSIAEAAALYAQAAGVRLTAPPVADAEHGVRVAFGSCDQGSLVEFVEPLGAGSPIDQFMRRGGGLYHICFSVPNLDASLAAARAAGGIIVSAPKPATAFAGKFVAFVYLSGNNLIEFVES